MGDYNTDTQSHQQESRCLTLNPYSCTAHGLPDQPLSMYTHSLAGRAYISSPP